MKKLLRYLVNTILFAVIWCLIFLPVMKYSIDMGATSIASIGGIIAIIISYWLVEKINKSNLWASLFDETEDINDVVEEKKVEVVEEKTKKKVEVEDSNIFNPKNITIGILAIVLISFLFLQFGGALEDTKQKDSEGLEIIKNNLDLLTKDQLYSSRAYTVRATTIWELNIYNIYKDLSYTERFKGDLCRLDIAIEEIGKAIELEPSNFHLYKTRASFLMQKATKRNVEDFLENSEIDMLMRKALIDIDIALSIYPKGKDYSWIQEGCGGDKNCELATIYMDRSVYKQNLGLEYCSDLRKACKLERTVCSCCGGGDQEDENCF